MERPLLILVLVAVLSSASLRAQPVETPPDGVQQLLPRGGIPAIFEPEFVMAAVANIPDSAWVLGVVVDGVAKAYSLNLLNHHEVVNDRFGERSLAAVW